MKPLLPLVSACLIALLNFSAGAQTPGRPATTPPKPAKPALPAKPAEPAGPPPVVWKSSTRSLAQTSSLEVRFPTEMVAAGDTGNDLAVGDVPITMAPPLKGRWVWRSVTSGVFILDEEPQRGQVYSFSVRPGLTDLLGKPLPPQAGFDQKATGLMMTHRYPTWFPGGNSPRQPQLILQFNDKVAAATAAKTIHFADKQGALMKVTARQAVFADLPAGYEIPPVFRQRALALAGLNDVKTAPTPQLALPGTLVVAPVEPLPVGEEWNLVVVGVTSADGRSKLDDSQLVKIGDVVPLSIDYTNVVNEVGEPKSILLRFSKKLTESTRPEEVTKRVKIAPAPKGLIVAYKDETVTLAGDFRHHTSYAVSLAGGLKSDDGLVMSEAFEDSFEFEMIEPAVALPAFSANQMAKGRGVFDVHSVNLERLTVKVKAADRDSLVYALRAYRSYESNGEDEEGADTPPATPPADDEITGGGYHRIPFDTMPGRKIFEQEFKGQAAMDAQDAFTIDWKKALGGQAVGALFVSVEGEARPEWDGKKKHFGAQAMVQLTDLGLAWKLTPDEAFLFVFSEATGQPLEGVKLSALDEENKALGSAQTAADGTVRLSRKDAAWLMAEGAGDLHAVELSEDTEGLGMWRFGVPYQWDPPSGASRSVTIFTERPVYLPGHTVYFKGVSRFIDAHGVKRPAAGEKAVLKAYDAKGRLFHERDVTLSAMGSIDGALELPAGVLGNYRIALEFPKPATEKKKDEEEQGGGSDDTTFSAYFLVEEYKVNTFQIVYDNAAFKLNGEQATLPLRAQYLLGKPLSKARLAWTASVGRGGFQSEAFEKFRFLDTRQTYYWDENGYHDVPESEGDNDIVTAQAKTDLSDKGEAVLEFAVPAAPFAKMPREISVTGEVTDLNQQTITERWARTLHPSEFYLGLGDLDSVSGTGKPVDLEVVAAKNDGTSWPQPVEAKVTVEKVDFVSVRVQTVGGGSNVKTQARRSIVAEGPVTTAPKGQAGAPFTWAPKEPGFYYLTARATDPQGQPVESVTSLQVYGESWATWEERDGVKIDLAADKVSYAPGETAKILVKSPVPGRALVTIERRNVMKHFLTEIKSNAQAIDVPIDESMAPNAFVSVFIIRGAEASPKQFKSPDYKFGICQIKVLDTRSQLKVAATAGQPTYLPGDEGTAAATVTDAEGHPVAGAEVTFWAVDDGILTLKGFTAPDLWADFHEPQGLAVLTGSSLQSLLAENPKELEFTNKGYVIGGGGIEALGEKLRKNFQPVAFWHGGLVTDAAGKVATKFTVPDNLTRFRLVAVAASEDDRFGTGEGSFEINKPLMIEPALPRFANVGDEVTIKGIVLNNTDQAYDVEVTLALDATAKTNQELMKKVSLAAREAKAVAWPLAFAEPGTAKWKWSAKSVTPAVKLADAVESILEVGFAQPMLHDLQYAALTPAAEGQNLLAPVNPELLEGRGQITLTLSNSTLAETSGAFAYLLHYPYGCVEQTTSSILPWLALHQLGDALPGVPRTPEEIRKTIQKGAARLLSMQTANGGLSYWPGGSRAELWASSYGGMGLVLCREAGAVVPPNRLEQLAAFLSASLRNTATITDSAELFDRAFACYTLALLGKAEPAYHDVLAQKIQHLPHPGRALLAMAMLASGSPADQAQKVLDDPLDPNLEQWTGNIFDSRLTAINLLVWVRLDPKNAVTVRLVERLLKERTPQGSWGSTYENAWALLALAAEAEANGKDLAASTMTVAFAGQVQKVSFPAKPASRTVTLPFTGQPTERELTVAGLSGGLLRAAVEVQARPKLVPVAPRAVGFGIARKYEKLSAEGALGAADTLEVGDLVAVTLDLDIPQRSRYIAVDDALPAILEAINPKFKSQAQTVASGPAVNLDHALPWWSSYEELRTDRALFFADELWNAGKYQIRYLARVVAQGNVTAPPAKIEAMYDPEKYGLSGTQKLSARAAEGQVAGK